MNRWCKQRTVSVLIDHREDIYQLLNSAKNAKHASQIHAQLVMGGRLSSPLLFNALLTLYSKCGHVSQSIALFTASNSTNGFDSAKNVFTYTSLITRLSQSDFPHIALTFFNEMRKRGIFPNHFTFSAILPTCGDMVAGKQMHTLIYKHGFESDVYVGSALVDMYGKAGEISCAEKVFDKMPHRNIVTWNSVIVGFLCNGFYDEAIGFFSKLVAEDVIRPDQVSFSSVLRACASICGLAIGRQVHGVVVKHGLEYLAYVKNSLMDMYSKCAALDDAQKLFSITEDRDVITWNVMVTAFVQNGSFEDACNYFWVMRSVGVLPDETSYSAVLHAAASIAALDQGSLIHDQIIKTCFGGNMFVTSSLITMYAKCGSLVDAKRVFSEKEDHNVISWTSMISAFQQHGCANEVIDLFEDMLRKGIEPDYVTFVSVLSACGHTGRVDDGFSYFNMMNGRYNLMPRLEHYACMVDLLGRSGRLNDAKKFVETMPVEPDVSVWGTLLGACRKYGNLDMGREVAERLFHAEPDNPGNYILLHNMYARRGRMEEANEVRRLMGFHRLQKEPGCSWIDVKNRTHVFKVHDRSHSRTAEIYAKLGELEELATKRGYVRQNAVDDVGEYEEQSLWYHSEKLALVYGLLTLPAGTPIRIKKNLRTCIDCHIVMKLASEIYKREIIVRDINRFHHFSNGFCSCDDFW